MSQTRVTPPRARNVVIFGESGSGKSSVINALAQNQVAATSSSAAGCTFRYQKHEVDLSGERFILFDTVGLDEGTAGTVPAAEAEANLKSLLRDLMSPESNGIGLLVYCVRSVRVSRALLRNYNLFYSAICRKKVPIVIVITGLENQEPTMDSWWDTNGKEFKKCGMHFEDHACVTTLRKHPGIPDIFTQRITESGENLRTLILNNCSEWAADASWFNLSFADVRKMIRGRRNTEKPLPPTLIICDRSQKEVQIAGDIYGVVETCSTRIGGVTYQIYRVPDPASTSQTSNIAADLLIFYAHADEQSTVRQRFNTFCSAHHGNVVPIIVVVKGLNTTKAAQEWVEQYLMQDGIGRPFATFSSAEDIRDRKAEQELQELIQQSCLIRSEGKSGGIHTTLIPRAFLRSVKVFICVCVYVFSRLMTHVGVQQHRVDVCTQNKISRVRRYRVTYGICISRVSYE
jgi:GTP-binding protein EngB required for normal cell division